MNGSQENGRPRRPQPFEGLASPFLDGELFTGEVDGGWQTHVAALEAEAPFGSAFAEPWTPAGMEETESAEAFEHEFAFEEQGIIRGDNRVRVQYPTGVPWRWICRIVVEDSRRRLVGHGTGVLVSNRHVLTAAHVVYAAARNMHQHTVTVIPALNDLDEPFGSHAIASKPRMRAEYDPAAADSLDWDYALLTLRKAVGAEAYQALQGSRLCYWASPKCGANTVFARLEPRALNGQAAYTAGYPGGKGGRQLWCASGILHSADARRRTMSTTADATQGQSGSPVWIIDNRRYCLVGLAVGAGTGSNRVVRVTRELVRQLRTWITADGEPPSMAETNEAWEPPVLFLPPAERYEPSAAEWTRESEEPEADAAAGEDDEPTRFHELPFEERFDPATVPDNVAEALDKKDFPLALRLAIEAGWRDENELTNLIFFARHPELPKERLDPSHPQYRQLSSEWSKLLTDPVWKAIQASAKNTDLVVSGEEVTDHHRTFFRGKFGKQFKKVVEDAAAAVDLNPGLLGTIMMAETRRPWSFLSRDKVSSYHIGADDFYEGRAAIQARVPAYTRVKWDRSQTPAEHLNDAQTNRRVVKTILFNSGPDAALATAVYAKFYEVRLREIAAQLKGDFDALPLPTRLALTRMAMGAGAGGATPFLRDALQGKDIFDRRNIPVRAYQTKRNATVRTAQAMHLSDWVFGIKVEPATPPGNTELEGWDEAQDEQEGYTSDPGLDEAEGWEEELDAASEVDEESGEHPEALELDGPWVVEEWEDDEQGVDFEYDVPTRPVREVVVGQRVELDLTQTPFGATLDKVKWTIPGEVVRGYEGTADRAAVSRLTADDLSQPKISFFWVNPGERRVVRAKIRTKTGTQETFAETFDVKGPRVKSFTGTPGKNRLFNDRGGMTLQNGTPGVAPGVHWKWEIVLPSGHDGFIKDLQTVQVSRLQVQLLQPGGTKTRQLAWKHPNKTEPHVQLDGTADDKPVDEPQYTSGLHEEKRKAGTTFAGRASDSPGTDLPSLATTVSVSDQFVYYLMFKPDLANPQDAIWVPVARARWSWKVMARQRDMKNHKWAFLETKGQPLIEKSTARFPVYESYAGENVWQEAAPARVR